MQSERLDVLRTAGVATYQNLGAWTYDSYVEINDRYFFGEVSPNAIHWGLTPYGASLGFYNPKFDTIMLHQSLVKASSHGDGNPWGMGEVLGLRLAYDILLHETIHQYLHQQNLYTPTDDAHRCQVWINELNRITQLLDLPYYFTQLRKTTKRVPVTGSEIQGKYCNVETHRVLQQPKKVVSVWVPQDEDVITVAESQQLQLATHKQLITFPYSIRPVDYYSADEKALLQSIFEDIDT